MRADGSSSADPPWEVTRLQMCVRFGWKPWDYDAMPDDDLYLFAMLTNQIDGRVAEVQEQAAAAQRRPAGRVDSDTTTTFYFDDDD
jgi:hypothetical protein